MIAIFTDVHAMLEPLEVIISDIKKRNISEVYSLGDNIGVGPNPCEVLDLLIYNNIKSVAGNSEYYSILGTRPYWQYFDELKELSQVWTYKHLNSDYLSFIKTFPPSIELAINNKKIGLCHFANDVRCDFDKYIRSTWTYRKALAKGEKGYLQFNYTNSQEQKREIYEKAFMKDDIYLGYHDAYKNPMFSSLTIDNFDIIIEGHVHFKLYEESKTTKFYTLRGAGMGMIDGQTNLAAYYILDDNLKVEEILLPFDRDGLINKVEKSDMPDKKLIKKYLQY